MPFDPACSSQIDPSSLIYEIEVTVTIDMKYILRSNSRFIFCGIINICSSSPEQYTYY